MNGKFRTNITKIIFALFAGENLVPKQKGESKTATGGRNREIEDGIVFSPPSPRPLSACASTVLSSSPSYGGVAGGSPHRPSGVATPPFGPVGGPSRAPEPHAERQLHAWGSTHPLVEDLTISKMDKNRTLACVCK